MIRLEQHLYADVNGWGILGRFRAAPGIRPIVKFNFVRNCCVVGCINKKNNSASLVFTTWMNESLETPSHSTLSLLFLLFTVCIEIENTKSMKEQLCSILAECMLYIHTNWFINACTCLYCIVIIVTDISWCEWTCVYVFQVLLLLLESWRSPCIYFQLVFTLIRAAKWQGNETRGGQLCYRNASADRPGREINPGWQCLQDTLTWLDRDSHTRGSCRCWSLSTHIHSVTIYSSLQLPVWHSWPLSALVSPSSCQGASLHLSVLHKQEVVILWCFCG